MRLDQIDAELIPAPSRLTHVIDVWHTEEARPRHLWRLFNDTTEALKVTLEIPEVARRTERLHGLADLPDSKDRPGRRCPALR